MKLGLIADIHGDLVSLRKALDLLHSHAVDHILCAGDLVNKGADAAGVIALLRESAIPTVQGNHDFDACADGFILVYANQRDGIEAPFTHGLSDDMQQYLSTLPLALIFAWEGQSIQMIHATTWDQITLLPPTADPALFRRVAREASAPVIVLAHTHIPMIASVAGQCLIINPGCVYYGYPEFRSTCAILTLPDVDVTFLDVETGAEFEAARVEL